MIHRSTKIFSTNIYITRPHYYYNNNHRYADKFLIILNLNAHFQLWFLLDVNYNLSDEMLIEIMKMAKSLSDVGATAAEVIHLTRCIVEYKADSKVNVSYMVHGLIERSVFEFTKKQIASK